MVMDLQQFKVAGSTSDRGEQQLTDGSCECIKEGNIPKLIAPADFQNYTVKRSSFLLTLR